MTMDSDGPSPHSPLPEAPPPDDSGHRQPKWAWWVVGIAVPLLGVCIPLVVGGDSSDPAPPSSQSPPAASPGQSSSKHSDSTSTSKASPGEEVGGTPKLRFGPGDLRADPTSDIDLDSVPPLVAETEGTDVTILFDNVEHGPPVVDTNCEDCTSVVAPLPSTGHEPSEAECVERIQKNKAFQPQITRGARFCVQTGEGRTAYLRVISAGVGSTPVRLKATVWELPD